MAGGRGVSCARPWRGCGAAGATGLLTVRADAGFYTQAVVAACQAHGARFSITVRQLPALQQVIAAIPEAAWQPTGWPDRAELAAVPYTPFKRRGGAPLRLLVSRVPARQDAQLRLFPSWAYHACISDRPGDPATLAAAHRRHATVEATIRDLKYGVGLNHFPSGHFGANAAWLAVNVLAHNLARWVGQLGLRTAQRLTTKTLRRRPAAHRALHRPVAQQIGGFELWERGPVQSRPGQRDHIRAGITTWRGPHASRLHA